MWLEQDRTELPITISPQFKGRERRWEKLMARGGVTQGSITSRPADHPRLPEEASQGLSSAPAPGPWGAQRGPPHQNQSISHSSG